MHNNDDEQQEFDFIVKDTVEEIATNCNTGIGSTTGNGSYTWGYEYSLSNEADLNLVNEVKRRQLVDNNKFQKLLNEALVVKLEAQIDALTSQLTELKKNRR